MTWRGTLLILLTTVILVGAVLFGFRARTHAPGESLIAGSPAEVASIEIRNGAESTVLERRDESWFITGPTEDRADPSAVKHLLAALFPLVPTDSLKPSDLKGAVTPAALDLKSPKRILILRNVGKKTLHTVSFGAEGAATGSVYSKVDADPSVYLVPNASAAIAFGPADLLRDATPLAVRADYLSEISLERRGGSERMKLRRNGSEWDLLTPLRCRADRTAVQDWIGKILGARILRWLPASDATTDTGLDLPSAVLTLREEGAAEAVLEIGREVPGTPGARYARCPARPGVFVLGNAEGIPGITPAELRSRHPSPVRLDSVDRIIISGRSAVQTLVRKPGGEEWILGETTVPSARVASWLDRLQGLTASEFQPATPGHLADFGFPADPTRIRFVAHLSENTAEEKPGEMTLMEYAFGSSPGGKTALREAEGDDLMIFAPEAVAPLLDDLLSLGNPITPSPTATPSPPVSASPR